MTVHWNDLLVALSLSRILCLVRNKQNRKFKRGNMFRETSSSYRTACVSLWQLSLFKANLVHYVLSIRNALYPHGTTTVFQTNARVWYVLIDELNIPRVSGEECSIGVLILRKCLQTFVQSQKIIWQRDMIPQPMLPLVLQLQTSACKQTFC